MFRRGRSQDFQRRVRRSFLTLTTENVRCAFNSYEKRLAVSIFRINSIVVDSSVSVNGWRPKLAVIYLWALSAA
jgi:hypothetical protein